VVYHFYGVRLRSDWALPYPSWRQPALADVTLVRKPAHHFTRARALAAPLRRAIVSATFPDGEGYLRWRGRFEFLVSRDGRTVAAHQIARRAPDTFHTHMLGQALSFALVRQGFDPLHATVVSVDGGAVALLGDSGYGKSTLAAAFVGAGDQLVTDDLLIVTETATGLIAHPGPPRLKLYPQALRRVLPHARGTTLITATPKLMVPLSPTQVTGRAVPLRALYVLSPPSVPVSRVTIRRLSQRSACLALIRNTFNTVIVDPDRLARQFALAARIAGAVPVKSVSYPRTFRDIGAVRDAILADMAAMAGRRSHDAERGGRARVS
jgi:hypothetical protein